MTWGDSEFASEGLEESAGMGKLVVGIGNTLLKDEGVGCHVAHALERISLPDVQVVDGGTSSDVLQLVDDADKLIIVDAVKGGGVPGQIYRFRPEDVTLEERPVLSLHDMSFVDSLKLIRIWRNIGEAVIIGIEPRDIGWGLELSAELREKMPTIIDAVLEELNNTNSKGETKC